MQEPTDSTRLLARGEEVIMSDGSAHRVRLDLEAAEFLETELGGLDVFLEGLNRYQERGWVGKRIGIVRTGMVACLLHETAEARFEGKLTIKRHAFEVGRDMDMRRLLEYVNALLGAIIEAFPGMEAKSDDDPKGVSASSHGTRSITSQRSDSVATIGNSGA